MDFALSTHLFVSERLNSHILDQILAAGIRKIEIFAARQHIDYSDAGQVRDLAQWFTDHDVTLHSVHAPLFSDADWGRLGGLAISVAYLERPRSIESIDEIKRTIEIAERLPFRYLVLHMGLFDEEYDLRKYDAAFTSIEHLKIFAKERGVSLLLENIPNELSTPERLLHFLEYTRLDLQVCFDTGHAHMGSGVEAGFAALKSRIASTHVHDNQREKDDHSMPYEGGINWEQTIRDFRAAWADGAEFPVVFELRNYGPEVSSLARLQEVMRKLEKEE
jgi:sugar phosphate isomerase/epimerase